MNELLPQLTVLALTALFLIAVVVIPAITAWRKRLPLVAEWTDLQGRIGGYQRDTVGAVLTLSEPTKHALSLVLSRNEGYGRLRNVPLALDIVSAPLESSARTLRALSGQAIVIGLGGTVSMFCVLFVRLKGTQSENLFTQVNDHLLWIYAVNGFCIAAAAIFGHIARARRQEADDVLHLANLTFGQLEEAGDEVIGPELAAALKDSAELFRRSSEELFTTQFGKVEALLEEVKILGTAITSVVKEVTENAGIERERVFQALLHEERARTDAFVERLDSGFKLLAQPFLQGIPAMAAMTEAATSLEKAGAVIVKSNVSATLTKLTETVQQLETVQRGLPDAIGQATTEAVDIANKGIRETLSKTLEEFGKVAENLRSDFADLHGSIENLPSALQKNRQEADAAVVASIAAIGARLSSALGLLEKRVATSDENLRKLLDSVRDEFHQLHKLLEQLPTELNRERQSLLLEWAAKVRTLVGSPILESLSEAGEAAAASAAKLTDAITETKTSIGQSIRTAEQRLLEALKPSSIVPPAAPNAAQSDPGSTKPESPRSPYGWPWRREQ